MKSLFLVVSLLLGMSAFAVNQNSSWNDIKKAGLIAAFPSVAVGGAMITVDSFCLNDNDVLTAGTTRQVCTKWEDGRSAEHDPVCVEYKVVQNETPLQHVARTCTDWREIGDNVSCFNWETSVADYALEYNVEIYKYTGKGDIYMFTKKYVVPTCD